MSNLSQFNEDLISQDNTGHSQLFAEFYKDSLYQYDRGWYLYNTENSLWEHKTNDQIKNLIPILISNLVMERKDKYSSCDFDTVNAINNQLQKILTSSRKATNIKNTFEMVKGHSLLWKPEFPDGLNKHPDLFPISNKRVVELQHNRTRERSKEDMFSFESTVDLLQDDECVHAVKFFQDITCKDKDVYEYLLKCLGNCLTGRLTRSFAILWGKGSNGKSVLLKFMEKILGPFFGSINKAVLIKNSKKDQDNGSGHTAHLEPLVHSRLCVISETSDQDELNSESIKRQSGDDTQYIRLLYKGAGKFKTQAKILCLTNHQINIETQDTAIIDRLIYFPFQCRFTQNPDLAKGELPQDVEFIENLETVWLSEIFTLLCKYCKLWYETRQQNNILPKVLQHAKNQYVQDQDSFSSFLANECQLGPKYSVPKSIFFEYYQKFCYNEGIKYRDRKEFMKHMKGIFPEKNNFKKGGRLFEGVKLINHNVDPDGFCDEDQESSTTESSTGSSVVVKSVDGTKTVMDYYPKKKKTDYSDDILGGEDFGLNCDFELPPEF